MFGYIAGPAASKTTGTFVLANNTTEQTIARGRRIFVQRSKVIMGDVAWSH